MSKESEASILRVRGGGAASARDWLAIERPLEIRGRIGRDVQVISTTMRTPGEDRALAVGFLFAERVIHSVDDVRALETVDDDTVLVELAPAAAAALAAARRPFVTTGACGVCGRTSLDAMLDVTVARTNPADACVDVDVIHGLPIALRAAQASFARTGGLHAAGLFTAAGIARAVHEDVGRHNAVDKLIGAALLNARWPAPTDILVVSGRASFELVQKAAVARIAVMVAVGAPSSLAVQIAGRSGMTLVGFARDDQFNVYCGAERLRGLTVPLSSEDSRVGFA